MVMQSMVSNSYNLDISTMCLQIYDNACNVQQNSVLNGKETIALFRNQPQEISIHSRAPLF